MPKSYCHVTTYSLLFLISSFLSLFLSSADLSLDFLAFLIAESKSPLESSASGGSAVVAVSADADVAGGGGLGALGTGE